MTIREAYAAAIPAHSCGEFWTSVARMAGITLGSAQNWASRHGVKARTVAPSACRACGRRWGVVAHCVHGFCLGCHSAATREGMRG